MSCPGSYREAVRRHPHTGAAECPVCARRFDYRDLAGEEKRNVPLHSYETAYQQIGRKP